MVASVNAIVNATVEYNAWEKFVEDAHLGDQPRLRRVARRVIIVRPRAPPDRGTTALRRRLCARASREAPASVLRRGSFLTLLVTVTQAQRLTRGAEEMVDASSSWASILRDTTLYAATVAALQPISSAFLACSVVDEQVVTPWPTRFVGYGRAMVTVVVKEGWMRLFAGTTPRLGIAVLQSTLADDVGLLEDDFRSSRALLALRRAVRYVRDVIPRVAVGLLTHPLEVISARMAILGAAGGYGSPAGAVRTVLNSDGWRGLYNGYASTLVMDLVLPGLAIRVELPEWVSPHRVQFSIPIGWLVGLPLSLIQSTQLLSKRGGLSLVEAAKVVFSRRWVGARRELLASYAWSLPWSAVLGTAVVVLAGAVLGVSAPTRRSVWARMRTALRRAFSAADDDGGEAVVPAKTASA